MESINTTKSMKKTSIALAGKIEKTKKNMAKMMADAGCPEYKAVKTMIPRIPGSEDDVLFIGLNGVGFYLKRGETVSLPEPLAEILTNTGEL